MEGIDIYDTIKGNITFVKTLNAEDLGFKGGSLNVMDVNSDDHKKLLYVLDYESGLIVLDISDLNKIVRIYQIFILYKRERLICL